MSVPRNQRGAEVGVPGYAAFGFHQIVSGYGLEVPLGKTPGVSTLVSVAHERNRLGSVAVTEVLDEDGAHQDASLGCRSSWTACSHTQAKVRLSSQEISPLTETWAPCFLAACVSNLWAWPLSMAAIFAKRKLPSAQRRCCYA